MVKIGYCSNHALQGRLGSKQADGTNPDKSQGMTSKPTSRAATKGFTGDYDLAGLTLRDGQVV